jgi:hypothetical protein
MNKNFFFYFLIFNNILNDLVENKIKKYFIKN